MKSTPLTQHAIDSALSDPDQVASGKPASVFGLAVDEVIRVTAKLKDGVIFSVAPVDNWYEIELPDGVAPWSVTTVDALLANGKTVTHATPRIGAGRPFRFPSGGVDAHLAGRGATSSPDPLEYAGAAREPGVLDLIHPGGRAEAPGRGLRCTYNRRPCRSVFAW